MRSELSKYTANPSANFKLGTFSTAREKVDAALCLADDALRAMLELRVDITDSVKLSVFDTLKAQAQYLISGVRGKVEAVLNDAPAALKDPTTTPAPAPTSALIHQPKPKAKTKSNSTKRKRRQDEESDSDDGATVGRTQGKRGASRPPIIDEMSDSPDLPSSPEFEPAPAPSPNKSYTHSDDPSSADVSPVPAASALASPSAAPRAPSSALTLATPSATPLAAPPPPPPLATHLATPSAAPSALPSVPPVAPPLASTTSPPAEAPPSEYGCCVNPEAEERKGDWTCDACKLKIHYDCESKSSTSSSTSLYTCIKCYGAMMIEPPDGSRATRNRGGH